MKIASNDPTIISAIEKKTGSEFTLLIDSINKHIESLGIAIDSPFTIVNEKGEKIVITVPEMMSSLYKDIIDSYSLEIATKILEK